ncbi:purine-binding chemotaxis protein CheW [Geoalkalibacter ferrihydriticus]|uniref:CheW-like domain-containing protein n=2 Tax=Geoalkalibacter ferrihydriticus TaxID=392333 RepID=A0A0C2EDZ2_9BACT|nr:chemotaxis protein CheW [Geoalkalibacter ferrihydriticus]KIH76818.1 hypothetical protein GFER_06815 [Geoalkalibacter ferrihydriticus DSM 17813]SDL49448.1 purine-binding chemotaxis protein CheW [Geoalkalibacter ferrihydriticus]
MIVAQDMKLVFRLGGMGFSVGVSHVLEILDCGFSDLVLGDAPLPRLSLGRIAHRGWDFEVFDGRRLFDLAPREGRSRLTVLVITVGESPFGLAVDRVQGIFPGSEFALRPLPPLLAAQEPFPLYQTLDVWRGEPLVVCDVARMMPVRGGL